MITLKSFQNQSAMDAIDGLLSAKKHKITLKNIWQHFFCRTHEALFKVLIFSLPLQLGKHWWLPYSFVLGRRIDYLSPTLYFTDILLLLVVLFGIAQDKSIRAYFFSQKSLTLLAVVGCLLVGNIFTARIPALSAYKALKIYELLMFIVYIRSAKPSYSTICALLAVSLSLTSVLALTQFFLQRAVGGAAWFLGERWFTASTPGIAQAILDGHLVLRPYATFSHPNVLAGYVAVVLPLVFSQSQTVGTKRFAYLISFFLGFIALLLTMSRAAWLAGILAVIIASLLYRAKSYRKLLWWPLIIAVLVAGLFARLFIFRIAELWLFDSSAITERIALIQAALQMFWGSPFFGVGLQGFIPALSDRLPTSGVGYLLQPVHSVYMLILAEAGLVGFFAASYCVIYLLGRMLRQHNVYLSISLLTLLFVSFADHYFFTLQQTQLLAALIIALSLL